MKEISKTIYNELPAIKLLGDISFCQRILCRSNWFKDYSEPKWRGLDLHKNLKVGKENIEIIQQITSFPYN